MSSIFKIPFEAYRPSRFAPSALIGDSLVWTIGAGPDTVVGEMRDKGEGEAWKRKTAVVRLYTKPADARLGPRAQEIVAPLLKPVLSK